MGKAVRKSGKVLALLLALVMVIGMLPATASAAEKSSQSGEKPTKVVVTVEGQTIGQGFYIEPQIVTFDEFINYWAQKGETVTPEKITAGGIFSYVLAQNGTPMAGGESVSGPGYMGSIQGVEKGYVQLPEFLAEAGVKLLKEADPAGSDLSEKEYTYAAGWMYTDGNKLSNQAMGGHWFYTYGKPYTQAGESYYVVRLMYTVADFGYDLGVGTPEWGAAPSYDYRAADKAQLYILYAKLAESGFLEESPTVKAQALAVMDDLQATQEEVDSAYDALQQGSRSKTPALSQDLSPEVVNKQVNDPMDPLIVQASAPSGTLSYQWYQSEDRFSWTALAGETGTAYTPSAAQNGTTYYKCVITNQEGNKLPNVIRSTVATVIVGTKPSGPMWINVDLPETAKYKLYAENPAALTFSPFGGDNPSFQWYQGPEGVASIDDMTPIDGATGQSYTPDVSQEGVTVYGCRLTNTKDGNKLITDSKLCTATVVNEVILVSDEEGLRKIANDPTCTYKLTNDIQLTGSWTEIQNFSGTLDGDGHTISGLNVESNSFGHGGGLFAYTMAGAAIKNLGLEGKVHQNQGNVAPSALIGAIYGDTTISNCYVNVKVTGNGENYRAGGLVGESASSALIENCYFTGTIDNVRSGASIGGIIGDASGGVVVKNCYTTTETAIGNYGGAAGADDWNNYCASDADEYAAKIPESMTEFLTALNNGGDAFAEDTANRNNGYPVLSWQAEEETPPVPPADPTEKEKEIKEILDKISGMYKGASEDWTVVDMAAYGYADSMDIDQLKANAETVIKDENASSTDYERVALALTAAGIDASAFKLSDGSEVNLIAKIADFMRNDKYSLGTVNGYIFALIAYDSGAYELSADGYWTRDKVVDYLLSVQGDDGGWNLSGKPERASDVDLTAMTINALANYQDDAKVSAALDQAVDFLSKAQNENGNFVSWGAENSNSAAQVIVALAALDIDADTDERFIKNEKSVVDSLLSFKTDDNQFGFTNKNQPNPMSTEQGFRALVAYTNWKAQEGPYNLYDFANNLVPDQPETVDKTALRELIAEAESLKKSQYTAESWSALEIALENAKEVEADAEAVQPDVFKAAEALQKAMDGLKKASGKPVDPDTNPSVPSKDPDSSSSTKSDEDTKNPQTGDYSNLWTWVAFMLVTGGGLLSLGAANSKKRHN